MEFKEMGWNEMSQEPSTAILGLDDTSRTDLSSLQFKLDPLIEDICSFYQNRTECILA